RRFAISAVGNTEPIAATITNPYTCVKGTALRYAGKKIVKNNRAKAIYTNATKAPAKTPIILFCKIERFISSSVLVANFGRAALGINLKKLLNRSGMAVEKL